MLTSDVVPKHPAICLVSRLLTTVGRRSPLYPHPV